MAYEVKPGSGTLFKNRNRRPDKNDPNYRGYFILPNGHLVGISAWIKETKSGDKMVSLSYDQRETEFQAERQDCEPVDGNDALGASKFRGRSRDDDDDDRRDRRPARSQRRDDDELDDDRPQRRTANKSRQRDEDVDDPFEDEIPL
ncbi:MAG: hypothetical protein KGL39_38135 [Patescibacteria group bacterium]|nr:hypothetical protein [Patescibacteria group bacterium]